MKTTRPCTPHRRLRTLIDHAILLSARGALS